MLLHNLERLQSHRLLVGIQGHLMFDLVNFFRSQLARTGRRAGNDIAVLDCVSATHLSTSAITKSILAMMATRSATMKPLLIAGIICRCAKEGVRIRVR